MPTRQIAIDEIIKEFSTLLAEDRAKTVEGIEAKKKKLVVEGEDTNFNAGFNLALVEIINLLTNRDK